MQDADPKIMGVFEAKTHFSALIDDAQAGHETLITKHGKPVARIVPAPGVDKARIDRAIEALMALRETVRGSTALESGETIHDYINAGRRYVNDDDEGMP